MAQGCVADVWSAEASVSSYWPIASGAVGSAPFPKTLGSTLSHWQSLASPNGGAWTLHTGERPRLSSLNVDILRPLDLQSWFCCPLGHWWDPGQTVSLPPRPPL